MLSEYCTQESTTIWIGATDQAEEGNWTWTDCSPWRFENWALMNGKTQQPDNSLGLDGDGENCAYLLGNKTGHTGWNDFPCSLREHHFVCSKPICSGKIYDKNPISTLKG